LPLVTNPVLIDGTTEPSYAGHPLIQIDGSGAGSDCDGLVLLGRQSVVQGLVVSGFSGAGIVLEGGSGNPVQGNQVGTDPGGTIAQPNGAGIDVVGSSSNTIGGAVAGAANLISGNLGAGIELVHSTQDSTAKLVAGNLIGTTADGLHALGNQEDGILLDSATSNTIGGTSAGEGNIISGNLGNGVETLSSSTDNLLEGNDIGTDQSGTLVLGNRGNGVSLGSSSNIIGCLTSGAGNTIANNGTGNVGAGVQLVGVVNQDTILSNPIHVNAGLGINLGNGPTPNHQPGTAGPNDSQNFQIFTSAQTDGKTTTIAGTLPGEPNSSYTLQVFWSPSPDPSGYGEGQNLVCTTSVETDSTGNCAISLTLPAAPPPGAVISATATDDAGNTSEFSPDISIRG
jgi:hypothetical protein